MEYTFGEMMIKPYLREYDSIVIEVNKEFIELTDFAMDELLGKSLLIIGDMLRINSQILLENINRNYSGFLFTKSLEVREVDISITQCQESNEKIYTFIEKLNSRLDDKLIFLDQLFKDNIYGMAIYSAPDLILLKVNQKYLDTLEAPFNQMENSIGISTRETLTGLELIQAEDVWNSVIETQRTNYMNEFVFVGQARGNTYWDANLTPVFEKGIMKYIYATIIDVTKRVLERQQREALENKIIKYQNEKLNLIIENMTDAVIIFDENGNYKTLNKSARDIYTPLNGIPKRIDDKSTIVEFYDTNGCLISQEDIPSRRVLRGEKLLNYPMTIKSGDNFIHTEINGTPIYDIEGNFISGILCGRDITEKVNIEREINKQNVILNRQADLLNLSYEAIFAWDLYGGIIYWNRGAELMYGYSSEEAVGCNSCDLLKTVFPNNINNIESILERDGVWCGEVKHSCKDGKKVIIETNLQIILNEIGQSIVLETNRDITNEILYKQSTERQLEMLTKLINNLDLPVMRMSYPELVITEVNQKAYSILKSVKSEINSIDDIKGKHYSDIYIKNDDGFDVLKYIREEIENKKIPYIKQRKWNLSREEKYVSILFQPLIGNNGEVEEIVDIVFDVTPEVKASKQIQKTLKMQEEIFANISHELKTPLNVIYSTVQLLNMYCNSSSLDERKDSIMRHIESIKQNSYRLSKLINNIVDVSKIEAGFLELNLSNNNIVEVVEEIVMSVTDYTNNKGLNIIFDTDIEEKIIACDPEKIERIVLNLISNAIKFSNEGDEILVEIKDMSESVEISVKDSGIGIENNHLNMIFDRFKQVDKSLSRNSEGTGIGLSLVKSIVELHGGHIYVESKFGKGSKFTVVLPAKRVVPENLLLSNKMRNKNESIRVEFSDI